MIVDWERKGQSEGPKIKLPKTLRNCNSYFFYGKNERAIFDVS